MLYAPVPGNHAAGSPDDENRGMQRRGAPHGTRWFLGMSNFTTTLQSMTANTFPLLLASKHALVFLPLLPNCRQSSRNKAPEWEQHPMALLQKPQLVSCCISFCSGYVPGLLMDKRDHYFSLFNEMTKQQICICRSRCCNRFDDSWPKARKMIYQQQLSLRYLGSDGQAKLHHLHRRVLKMTIWIKSWSTNLI